MPDNLAMTRWSLIVAASSEEEGEVKARAALEELCQIYWQPVFQFILRRGFSTPDAEDLCQEFFSTLAGVSFLRKADPDKGRFRALVFAALRNFLLEARLRRGAAKRGADVTVSLEDPEADGISETAADVEPAAAMFDQEWAIQIARRAFDALREEFVGRGRTREWEILRPFLTGSPGELAYTTASRVLNLPINTVRSLIRRTRSRCAMLLREEVAQTLAEVRDVDDELRYLCRMLSARSDSQIFPAQRE